MRDIALIQKVSKIFRHKLVKNYLQWDDRREALANGLEFWKYQMGVFTCSGYESMIKIGQDLKYGLLQSMSNQQTG